MTKSEKMAFIEGMDFALNRMRLEFERDPHGVTFDQFFAYDEAVSDCLIANSEDFGIDIVPDDSERGYHFDFLDEEARKKLHEDFMAEVTASAVFW